MFLYLFHCESHHSNAYTTLRSVKCLFTYLRGVVAAAHDGSGCELLRPYPTTQDTTVSERRADSRERCTDYTDLVYRRLYIPRRWYHAAVEGRAEELLWNHAGSGGVQAWPCPQATTSVAWRCAPPDPALRPSSETLNCCFHQLIDIKPFFVHRRLFDRKRVIIRALVRIASLIIWM